MSDAAPPRGPLDPPDGIHEGVPFAEYCRWRAISYSALREMAISPGRYRWRSETPRARSDEMVLGSAVDAELTGEPPSVTQAPTLSTLGPEFAMWEGSGSWSTVGCREWRVATESEGRIPTKPGDFDERGRLKPNTSAAREWRRRVEERGLDVITPTLGAKIRGCVEAVRACPAWPLLERARTQVSIIRTVEVDIGEPAEIRLKHRLDCLAGRMIVDLKTTQSAERDAFARHAAAMRYHWQAAMYLDGYAAATGEEICDWRWLVVERDPPHRVELWRLGEAEIELGRQQYTEALRLLAYCRHNDWWPASVLEARPNEDHWITFPRWTMRDLEE